MPEKKGKKKTSGQKTSGQKTSGQKTSGQKTSGLEQIPQILTRPLWKDRLVWIVLILLVFWFFVIKMLFFG